ncbi:protein mono-ADP-ribosyltransferase PARP9 isoform X2 [Fundulus heteroclitus]|uniref:protein mono-ADP-ribosyltransferase PARP9 isoform X2 n=1 Tax=Fundulus heteroclitus TaxID=8078 RepID=UPI00165BEB54|nr:protein mono-ADP-ribosyltransferase PARP9 isoform X2 [Fundulus heteroclitus]
MDANLNIHLNRESVNIVKKCGDALCKVLYDKFGCVATINGVEMENESRTSYQRQPSPISPEKRWEFRLRSGVKISVWKADLTNFSADAVVNAANKYLQHYGGLAQALSTAGGPQIQKESADYVQKYGNLKTGEAVVFDAGSLPYNKIIHAVGPELDKHHSHSDFNKAESLLVKAICSILNKVEEYHLKSVAIPAISSGLFHYPLRDCADTIASTVKRYYDNLHHQNHRPKEIFLVNHDEPTVKEMERACRHIFDPQQHQTYSQAAAGNSRGAANTPTPSFQMGNVRLTLKKGKIEEERTDVIVNTASVDRNLSIGKISNAILQKAGYEIQNEISRAVLKGSIIHTRSYQLQCKEVFHTFCPEKGNDPAADQKLYFSVYECLMMAVGRRYVSITFPAIGTGALGFSKAESASIMLSAVYNFAHTCSTLLEVYLVIFPSDHETFQAFQREMGLLQQRLASFSVPLEGKPGHQPHQHHSAHSGESQWYPSPEAHGPKDESHTSRALTPQISLDGPSEESKYEAQKWLKDLLSMDSHAIKIYNNFISHFSDTDHLRLSRFAEKGLFIEEFFTQGHACIEINGEKENAAVAAVKVEAMLCKVQKDFISEEECELQVLVDTEPAPKRQTVRRSSREFTKRADAFSGHGLKVKKVEEVENRALKKMFELKKKQLDCFKSETMFQRIPAQFCEMISRIGFQAECAPPEDPKYGEGIYFTSNIKRALDLWRDQREKYLYFVEAEVLTGASAPGSPGLLLPPVKCDSVHGGSDVSVIFSGYQALPKYIITCEKVESVSLHQRKDFTTFSHGSV